ncbi:hypothetical protein LENED_004308 [Lentinula edodes]|uniref:Uncharacterized protein n=1 Tax=Lentinula edodes TaxID=5353 RepID=A0A1Q3E5W1_LENED|nr:hypothetical protein LENED_004308 [Lentinula edodes]
MKTFRPRIFNLLRNAQKIFSGMLFNIRSWSISDGRCYPKICPACKIYDLKKPNPVTYRIITLSPRNLVANRAQMNRHLLTSFLYGRRHSSSVLSSSLLKKPHKLAVNQPNHKNQWNQYDSGVEVVIDPSSHDG